jgi:tetratricopeptide (TPR) repeat protein
MQEDVSESVVDAERAVRLDPHNTEGVQILAGLYARQNRPQNVQRTLEQGIADNPKSVPLRLALADFHNAQQHPELAERLQKEVIALEPKDAGHRINLARYYASGDRLDAAEATLRQGVSDLPNNPVLTGALIDFLHVRRGMPAAERELRARLASNPKDDELSFVLGNLYLSDHQPDKAREVFQSIVKRDGSKSAVLSAKSMLAAMRFDANDVAGARALIKEVLDEDALNSDALQLRARIALSLGNPRDAIVDLRAVVRADPNSVAAQRLLAQAHSANHEPALALQVLEHAVDSNQGDNALRLDLVNLLMSQGRAEEAEQSAELLAQREPRNPVFLRAAFTSELASKNFRAATETARAFEAALPERPDGYYLSGVAAEANNDLDGAIGKFEKSLQIAPTAHEPLKGLVRVYARAGKPVTAAERLEKFAQANPQDPLPKLLEGELWLTQKKLPEAAAAFQAAITIDPHELPPYQGLARVRYLQHDFDGAAQTLRGAQSQVPAPEIAAVDLANLYQTAGRPDDAIATYEAALRFKPGFDVASNNLAMLLASRGDSASLDRALELTREFGNSTDPTRIDTLGWVRLKRGDTDGALRLLAKALDMAPDNATVRYHLALAQLKAGQTDSARDNLQRALKDSGNFEGSGDARTVLASLAPVPASALAH